MPKLVYDEIFQDLKERIEKGKYLSEGMLPSENELTAIYSCSRNTIRRAISMLTAIGYTQPVHGKGVHIIYTPPKPHQRFYDLNFISGLCQAGRENNFKVENKVLTFTDMQVDARLAEKSGFEEGLPVYFIQRLRFVEGDAKMLDTSFLRKDLLTGLTKERLSGSLFQFIEESGITIQTVKRFVTMEKVTPMDEKYLSLDGYNTLAVVTSQVYSTQGIQFEYTQSRNRPDLFAFSTVATRNV